MDNGYLLSQLKYVTDKNLQLTISDLILTT